MARFRTLRPLGYREPLWTHVRRRKGEFASRDGGFRCAVGVRRFVSALSEIETRRRSLRGISHSCLSSGTAHVRDNRHQRFQGTGMVPIQVVFDLRFAE